VDIEGFFGGNVRRLGLDVLGVLSCCFARDVNLLPLLVVLVLNCPKPYTSTRLRLVAYLDVRGLYSIQTMHNLLS